MKLTSKFQNVLSYAAKIHNKQVRKSTKIPYISHWGRQKIKKEVTLSHCLHFLAYATAMSCSQLASSYEGRGLLSQHFLLWAQARI